MQELATAVFNLLSTPDLDLTTPTVHAHAHGLGLAALVILALNAASSRPANTAGTRAANPFLRMLFRAFSMAALASIIMRLFGIA
jgi:hypothetical protein